MLSALIFKGALSRFIKWVEPVLLVALAVLAAMLFWCHWNLMQEETAHAKTKADNAAVIANLQQSAREQSEANRKIEQRWSEVVKEKEKEHAQIVQGLTRAVAALRAGNDRLRDEAARAATGNRGPADDSLASCRMRAEGLAQLFNDAAAEAARMAEAADRASADVNLTCEAWPRAE